MNWYYLGELLFISGAIVVVLYYFGWGITRLLWPVEWRRDTLLVAPVMGYALLATAEYILLFLGFNLTVSTLVLLVLLLPVNGYAFRIWAGRRWRERGESSGPWVWVFAMAAFLLAVAPLVRYGYITLIGENWDPEFYLPLAQYLQQYTPAQLASAPPNPLIGTLTSLHIGPLPMGFSYLHGTVNLLFGLDALDSFPILSAVLHAMSIPAAYAFYRRTLGMRRRTAWLACFFLASSGLLLWVTYWGFGLHLASLALLPVAIMLGVRALQTRQRADLPLAALALAGLNVTFHPALIAALLPLGLLGLFLLWRQTDRSQVLRAGAGLVGLAIAFSFPTLWHIGDFIREYYGRAPLATGLRDFIPVSDGLGLSLYTLNLVVGQTIPTPDLYALAQRIWNIAGPLLTLFAVGLALWGLWRLRNDENRRVVWWTLVGTSVAYVLIFRLPFLRPYPYGFLKALTLIIFVLSAAVAQGAVRLLFADPDVVAMPPRVRLAARLGILALAAANLFSLGISLEQYYKPAPNFFSLNDLSIRQAVRELPAGASVWLTDRKDAGQLEMGLVAYALRAFPLAGQVQTGYATFDHGDPSQPYDYALLARGEVPQTRGYAPTAIWTNSRWAIYPRPKTLVQHVTVSESLAPGSTRTISLSARSLITGTLVSSGETAQRNVTLGFTSLITREVQIQVGGRTMTETIRPGLTVAATGVLTVPLSLTLRVDGADSPLHWGFADLWEPSTETLVQPPVLAAQARSQAQDGVYQTDVGVANPGREVYTWSLVVRGTPATGRRQEQEWLNRGARAVVRSAILIRYDPGRGQLELGFDGTTPRPIQVDRLEPGKYRAALEVYRGGLLRVRLELYAFERRGDAWQFTPMDSPPVLAIP